jgi:hypothetical protein
MERSEYLKKCQLASYKTDTAGAWWTVDWSEDELVGWRGELYVPVDYMFGFKGGNVTGVAIMHSTKANSVVHAMLKEVEDTKDEGKNTGSEPAGEINNPND